MFKAIPDNPNAADKFIKHDSKMLKQIYGSDDVTPYWIADMAFPIATPITTAMQDLVSRETYSYEFDSDTIFKEIALWNQKRHGLELEPTKFVQVPGVLSAIALLIREFTEKGEGVLIQTPVYHQFRRLIESAGRTVVNNTLKIEQDHYVMDFDAFENQLRDGNVKMVLLCNPHNPVGRVWTQQELARMVEIAEKYQTWIVSDEVHADIVFDGAKFTSMAEFDYEKSVTIIGSPAKNFGLNSISNGYIYTANSGLKEQINATVESMALNHGNAFTTYATIAAYQQGEAWFEQFLQYTQESRDWIVGFMAESLPQVRVFKPQGTNQIWFDFSGLGLEAEQLKLLLVNDAKLALTPGTWFGEPDKNFYRMNFAAPLEQLKASLQSLRDAVNQAK
ncbi:PatB family C-S lyase [Vibrio sp. D420a]|uniref:MalY/PatB family protein n=1 Tax=Vibrio sp. D420a TaxID=2836895 RepID=UPI0025553D68|nr:PatB family C-S lyase [Vibrio sp. D420a]MDK9764220.1 PatB family C-S lyase [Vibrio sp. D420a]